MTASMTPQQWADEHGVTFRAVLATTYTERAHGATLVRARWACVLTYAREDGSTNVLTEWWDQGRDNPEPTIDDVWPALAADAANGAMPFAEFVGEYGSEQSAVDAYASWIAHQDLDHRLSTWLAGHPDNRARQDLALITTD